MDEITQVIQKRLVDKGTEISTIPAYIRDLSNIISAHYDLNLQNINTQLQLLGWDDFELDYHTLQLIIAFIESNDSHSKNGGWATVFEPADKIEINLFN